MVRTNPFPPHRCSFASVNIPLVAVWLSGLTGEERERFQMLRRKFAEIQVRKVDERARRKARQVRRSPPPAPSPVYLWWFVCATLKRSDLEALESFSPAFGFFRNPPSPVPKLQPLSCVPYTT